MDSNSPKTIPSGIMATRFLKELAEATQRVIVTDGHGREIPLEKGMGAAVDLIADIKAKGGKLMLVGNGGSAAMAGHGALDFWKNGGVEAMAFNDASSLTAISNDSCYEEVFALPIRRFAKGGDMLLAISSSGASPNILRAVEAAREMRCQVITLSGFEDTNPIRGMGDLNFWVPSGLYGVVETVHDGLRHAIVEELMHSYATMESPLP